MTKYETSLKTYSAYHMKIKGSHVNIDLETLSFYNNLYTK